ncbi:MAG: hypothetical protein ACREEH_04510 [Caulobacteraceae bacterium]
MDPPVSRRRVTIAERQSSSLFVVGRLDRPIQALRRAEPLARTDPQRRSSSPLKRAMETSEAALQAMGR